MRKLSLYIASSIDGYIARPDGAVDWLEEFPNPDEPDMGYFEFIKHVDTLLFGAKTYRQVLTFGEWPYEGKECFVFTRNPKVAHDDKATFISGDIVHFVSELKQKPGNTIWLVGGGEVNSLLLQNNLIDEIILSVIPMALGDGIPLFARGKLNKAMKVAGTKAYTNGVVQITYVK